MHSNNNTDKVESINTNGAPNKAQRSKELHLFNLLQKEEFRDYIWALLERCHMFQTTFTGNSQSYFQEGERNVGLQVLHEMNACDPDAYIKMMQKSLKNNNNS